MSELKQELARRGQAFSFDPNDLKEEDKPGCFGVYGSHSCTTRFIKMYPDQCVWSERCLASRSDY